MIFFQVHPEGKFVVDLDKNIDINDVTPNARVALRNDSYTLHKILPSKVIPVLYSVMVTYFNINFIVAVRTEPYQIKHSSPYGSVSKLSFIFVRICTICNQPNKSLRISEGTDLISYGVLHIANI